MRLVIPILYLHINPIIGLVEQDNQQTTFAEISDNVDKVLHVFYAVMAGQESLDNLAIMTDTRKLQYLVSETFEHHRGIEHFDFISWTVMKSAFERMVTNEFFESLDKPFQIIPQQNEMYYGMDQYAMTLKYLSTAFPADRSCLLLASVVLHWIQKTYTTADQYGISRWEGFSSYLFFISDSNDLPFSISFLIFLNEC